MRTKSDDDWRKRIRSTQTGLCERTRGREREKSEVLDVLEMREGMAQRCFILCCDRHTPSLMQGSTAGRGTSNRLHRPAARPAAFSGSPVITSKHATPRSANVRCVQVLPPCVADYPIITTGRQGPWTPNRSYSPASIPRPLCYTPSVNGAMGAVAAHAAMQVPES